MIATSYMRIDPAYREALKAAGIDRVDAILALTEGRIVAWSRTTDSVYVPGANGGVGFYVKRYTYPTWRKRLRGAFRGTFFGTHRAIAESRTLNAMRALGITAIRPVAYGCQRIGRFLTASFLVTEEVPSAPNLTSFAQDVSSGHQPISATYRHAMARELARQVREMHESHFAHGRLFWRNILIREGSIGLPEFFFLDSEPPKRFQMLQRGENWWVWELAKLATSSIPFTTRTDQVRFMKHYLQLDKLTDEAKVQLREIGVISRRWAKHEQQRIRMSERFTTWRRQLDIELAEAGEGASA